MMKKVTFVHTEFAYCIF